MTSFYYSFMKMPKIKFRRPKILRRKRQNVTESSPDCSEPARVTCASKVSRMFESSGRSDQNSVSTDPSFTSDDWIKEFNARARCRSGPKLRKPSEDSTDDVETNFYNPHDLFHSAAWKRIRSDKPHMMGLRKGDIITMRMVALDTH